MDKKEEKINTNKKETKKNSTTEKTFMLVCKQKTRRNQPLNLNSAESLEIIVETFKEFRYDAKMPLKVNSEIFTVLRKRLGMNLKDNLKAKQLRLLNFHIKKLVPSKDATRSLGNAATDSHNAMETTEHMTVETVKAEQDEIITIQKNDSTDSFQKLETAEPNKAENDSIADLKINQNIELPGAYNVNISDVSIINDIDFENKVIFDTLAKTSDEIPHSIEVPDTSNVVMTDVPILYDIDFGNLSLLEEKETLTLANDVSVNENKQPTNVVQTDIDDDILNSQIINEFGKYSSDFKLNSSTEEFIQKKKETSRIEPNSSTRNNREIPFHKKDFFDCGIEFKISRKEFEELIDPITKRLISYKNLHDCRKETEKYDDRKRITGYQDLIRRIHPECVMYVVKKKDELPKIKQDRTITIYAVCQHAACKRFIITATFKIKDCTDIEFRILHDMEGKNHPDPMAAQIRGKDRVEVKNILIQKRHKDFRRDQINMLSEDDLNENKDLGHATSESTVRKLASEVRKDLRRHEQPMASLQSMAQDNDTYIQWLDHKPFTMILMTKSMVEVILKASKKHGPLDFHLDATGSAWSDPRVYGKGKGIMLMHSLVTRFPCHESDKQMTTFPLAEIFTSDQTALNIEIFLRKVVGFVQKYTSRPLTTIFRAIIIDFCAAYIKAIPESFNLLTVVDYLKECHRVLEKRQEIPDTPADIVLIRLCTSHMSKIVYKDVDDYFPLKGDKIALTLKIALTSLFDIYDIKDVFALFKALWQYILEGNSDIKTKAYEKVKNIVEKYTGIVPDNIDEEINNCDESDEKKPLFQQYFDQQTIYESCPFYIQALSDFETILKDKQLSTEYLKESNPGMLKFIMMVLQKYMTYIVLVSPVLTFKKYDNLDKMKNIEANRANNGLIEAHHKDTKADIRNSIVVGNLPIRLDDHITHIFKRDVETKTQMFLLAIPRSRATRNIKKSTSTPKQKLKSIASSQTSGSSLASSCASSKSIGNSDFNYNMRISDLKKTKERYNKRSMKSENDGPRRKRKKIHRALFPVDEMKQYFVDSQTVSVAENEMLSTIMEESSMAGKDTQQKNEQIDLGVSVIDDIIHTASFYKKKSVFFEGVTSTPVHSESKTGSLGMTSLSREPDFKGFSTFMENQLISNIEYYTKYRPNSCYPLKVVFKGNERLEYGDMKTLWDKNYIGWLSNFLVEYSFHVLCSTNSLQATRLLCHQSCTLFGISKSAFNETITDLIMAHFSYPIILCPVLHSNHFTVAIIDKNKNEFHYLDSQMKNTPLYMYKQLETALKEESKVSNNESLKAALKLVKKLKVVDNKINFQSDEYHCGIHIINNSQKYLKGKELLDKFFDATECRKQFIHFLLSSSDTVNDICYKCGREDPYTNVNNTSNTNTKDSKVINWIRCDQCCRWWHSDCAKLSNDHRIPEYSYEGFTCIMCFKY